jgi:hypothetical protein
MISIMGINFFLIGLVLSGCKKEKGGPVEKNELGEDNGKVVGFNKQRKQQQIDLSESFAVNRDTVEDKNVRKNSWY